MWQESMHFACQCWCVLVCVGACLFVRVGLLMSLSLLLAPLFAMEAPDLIDSCARNLPDHHLFTHALIFLPRAPVIGQRRLRRKMNTLSHTKKRNNHSL